MLTEKLAVEKEWQDLSDEQKRLEDEAKELATKIIQEYQKKNVEKKLTLGSLKSQIDSLKAQLGELLPPETLNNTTGEPNVEAKDAPPLEELSESIQQPVQEAPLNMGIIESDEIELTIPDSKKKKK